MNRVAVVGRHHQVPPDKGKRRNAAGLHLSDAPFYIEVVLKQHTPVSLQRGPAMKTSGLLITVRASITAHPSISTWALPHESIVVSRFGHHRNARIKEAAEQGVGSDKLSSLPPRTLSVGNVALDDLIGFHR